MFKAIALVSLFISFAAHADYFGCELKVGNDPAIDVEAPYRGREVTVSHKGWTCSSVIDNNIIVTVNLQSPQANASSTVSDRASARTGFAIQDVNDEEGMFITGSCKCGLR